MSRTPELGEPRDPGRLFEDAGLERDAEGNLRLGEVALGAIAGAVGTPAYVYHLDAIGRRYRALDEALRWTPHRISFAVKSNGSLAVLAHLAKLGAGADIVSGGELARSLRAGFPPSSVVFSGVGKTAAELEAAIEARIGSINLESTAELGAVESLVQGRTLGDPVRLGIRINPGVESATHPYIMTGAKGLKFGVSADEALPLARRIAANPRFRLVTLAMHLGSQLLEASSFSEGATIVKGMIDELRGLGIETLESLDVGGGMGIRYRDDDQGLEPARLASALEPLIAGSNLRLHLQPGRFIVGSAGVLLTKVLYRKRSGGKDFVVVDAAMNDLVRPSHYQAHHEIVPLGRPSGDPVRVDVVGPVCETGDFLALDRMMADPKPGEVLAILGAGAYGFAMSSNYNTRPRPPEIVVQGGRFAVARPRETIDDLTRGECPDPWGATS